MARSNTIKDATVRRFHYDAHDQFSNHLADFVQAYDFAKRLKTLKGLIPCEFICKAWTNQPERFTLNPLHQMPGLDIEHPEVGQFSFAPAVKDRLTVPTGPEPW